MKKITLNNLGELFNEFKNCRNSKWKNIAKKENFYDYIGSGLGFFKIEKEIKEKDYLISVSTSVGNDEEETELTLNLPSLEESEFDSKYKKQIVEVLKEVWKTGEMKNAQGLDLNWPMASKENNKPVENSSSPTKSSDKESKIVWWIGGGILFILAVLFLVYLFRRERKIKK